MNGVNKVILIGHLGKDPEIKKLPNDTQITSFSIATTEKWVSKSGDAQTKTEWHNIVAFGKPAEIIGKYMKKGNPIYLEGKITNRSWDGNDGQKKYKTEIVVNQFQFLGGKNDESTTTQTTTISENKPTQVAGGQNIFNQPAVDDDLPF